MADNNIIIDNSDSHFKVYENENNKIYFCGVLVYISEPETIYNIKRIVDLFISAKLDFNCLHGFYKIIIINKMTGSFVFWGDNVGSQLFYIDQGTNEVSDSLLQLTKKRNSNLKPDYLAISQFLKYARIFTDNTIVDGIVVSNAEQYYEYNNGIIIKHKKQLMPFSDDRELIKLDRLTAELCKAIETEKYAAICTGGTDSRTVLANIKHCGGNPQLIITGHTDNPDLPISKEVAKVLGLPLHIIDPGVREKNWIEKGFVLCDGVYDSVLSYRHYLKARWEKENSIAYEFGGVGGEFYKNEFVPIFRGGYFYKLITDEVLFNAFFNKSLTCPSFFGDSIRNVKEMEIAQLKKIIKDNNKGNRLCRINSVGSVILRNGYVTVTNPYSKYCTKIDPLVDRDIIASVCDKSILKMSMHMWSRKQVNAVYPALSEIATDRGLSLSLKHSVLAKERINRICHYSVLAKNRVLRKIGINKAKKKNYWAADYSEAVACVTYDKAINVCKKLGVLSKSVSKELLPQDICGLIITIGLMFEGSIAH